MLCFHQLQQPSEEKLLNVKETYLTPTPEIDQTWINRQQKREKIIYTFPHSNSIPFSSVCEYFTTPGAPSSLSVTHTHGSCWAHLIARVWPFTGLKDGKLICFATGWGKCKLPMGLTLMLSYLTISISPGLDLSLMLRHVESEMKPFLVLMWSLFWCKTPSGIVKIALFFQRNSSS